MQRKPVSHKTFKTPFCREYWQLAFSEFKDTRMIVFAALILALRVAVKPLSIPVAGDLKEGVGFIVNAFGSMIYGPVLALLSGALSDTLGYLLYPSGVYFPAYMITEMAGSFVFALFLYRAEITVSRLLLCRFSICLFVNVVLSYPIHVWYWNAVMGKAYSMALVQVVKNVALFPIETVVLAIVFRALIPPFHRLGYIYSGTENLEFTKKHIILLVCLFIIGLGTVAGYSIYSYNTTSLSASYNAEQRLARNRAIETYILDNHPELDPGETVCIIESAYPKAFSPEVTYQVAVYAADVTGSDDPDKLMTELEGLSKSKAAARSELTILFREDVLLSDQNAKEPEKGAGQK